MSVEVKFTMFGDLAFRHRLRNLGDRADNMLPVMQHLRDKWILREEEQFDTEGARTGIKWDKLKYVTVAKRGSNHPILIDSGDLFDEVLTPTNYNISDGSIEYTAPMSDEYGGFHQTGTKKMARRPIVDFTDMDNQSDIYDI